MMGVVSPLELSAGIGSRPLAPSSATLAVLVIWSSPAGSGAPTTVRAKVAVPLPPPPARLPMVRLHSEPAPVSGTQLQPAVLAPALKTVWAGTVSVTTTPVALWLPTLE